MLKKQISENSNELCERYLLCKEWRVKVMAAYPIVKADESSKGGRNVVKAVKEYS